MQHYCIQNFIAKLLVEHGLLEISYSMNSAESVVASRNATWFCCPKAISISSDIRIQTYHSIYDVPRKEWCTVVPENHILLQYDFLAGIENAHRAELGFRYLVIFEHNRPIMTVCCQIVTFNTEKIRPFTQNAAASTFWEKTKNFVSYQFAELASSVDVRMLVCGNVFLSGQLGICYGEGVEEAKAFSLLNDALEKVRQDEKAAGKRIWATLAKDFPPHAALPAKEYGYHPFSVEPIMTMNLPKEWKNFDDYLSALASKYRQRVKSTYKKSQVLTYKELSLEEVEQNTPLMRELFLSVVGKAGFNLQESADDYLVHLKRSMGDKYYIRGYYLEDKMLAFMSILKTGEHEIEAHFLGYSDEDNHEYKIYQRILYDIIQYGIENQMRDISFGRTAMEIKTTVGAVPNEMNLYLQLSFPVVNRLAGPVMKNLKQPVWQPRHPFKGQEEQND